jgi:hypothetical protein
VHRSGTDLMRLTDDHFDDRDPDWSPDGRRIVFSSDRCPNGKSGAYNLYVHDLENGTLASLTCGPYQDQTPAWSPDGRLIAFCSNRDDLVMDLWVTDLAGNLRPAARMQTATMDPEWSPDGRSLLCTSFIGATFAVFQVPLAEETLEPVAAPPMLIAAARDRFPGSVDPEIITGTTWQPDRPDTTYSVDHYRRRFGLDMISGGVAYDPEFGGGAGGGQIALSDLLGNERLYFFLANDGGSGGSFLNSFDVGFSYYNLARRLNWGVGVFRLTRTYHPDLDIYRRETRVGGMFVASYPLSRFDRIETSLVVRSVSDHLYRSFDEANTYFISNLFTYVHDATLWNYYGPFAGSRFNISVGLTTDIGQGVGDYSSLLVDYRRYHRLTRKVVHAMRVAGRFSFGDEGQLYWVGGAHSLRGYGRRSVLAQRLAMINNEIRIPFIERMLLLGFMDMPIFHVAGYFDVAWAGDRRYTYDTLGAFGFAWFIGGGPFPRLRVDYTWRTDFETVSSSPYTELSIGFNY